MIKINSVLSILVILIALTGCYKDKGNYNYKNFPTPLISGIEKEYQGFVGDKLTIEPIIEYQKGSPEIKNAEYSWIFDKKEVSKERNLDIIINLTPGEKVYASFTVKDVDNEVSTIVKFTIIAQSEFKQGWLILSEVDGKGHLCYQRADDVFYENIYESLNGEPLSSNPVRLREHWLPGSSEMGQVNVICKGGPNYSVELDGTNLSKIIYNKQEFVGDKTPENFAPINALYVKGYDMIVCENGKMYTRQITSGNDAKYQEGLFVDVPSYGDYELTGLSMRGKPVYDETIISYDRKNKRYVLIYQGEISSINTNKDPNKVFPVENMDKEVIAGGTNIMKTSRNDYVSILKSMVDKKYYMQRFYMSGYGAKTFYSVSEVIINDEGVIVPDTKFAIAVSRPFVFMTNGSKLYRYNIDTNQAPELIKDYGKMIQSIALNITSDKIGMVIGDGDAKNNDFITADVSVVGGGKIVTKQEGVCGKGIDVIFKTGNQWDI